MATEDDRTGVLKRAMQLGEEAVRADSTNPEAYYQSAHAVGRYAQSVGTLRALRRGLAGRIRGLLEATLAIYPDFAEAHMAFGGWHADIASAGRIARFMYGGQPGERRHPLRAGSGTRAGLEGRAVGICAQAT